MSYDVPTNVWSRCSKQDQETVFRKSHYRCMGGGKMIKIFFTDISDVCFFYQGVLGPAAGAMENRYNLDATKELASARLILVPNTVEASALSTKELVATSSGSLC